MVRRDVEKREWKPIAEEFIVAFPGFGSWFLVHGMGKRGC